MRSTFRDCRRKKLEGAKGVPKFEETGKQSLVGAENNGSKDRYLLP